MNVPRHDSDLALSGRDYSRTVWPDQSSSAIAEIVEGSDHINRRYAFGYANRERQTGIRRFHDGVGGEGGRNIDRTCIRSCFFYSLRKGVEDRHALVLRSPFSRRYAGDNVCSVRDHLTRMKRTFFPGDSLNYNASAFINKDAQFFSSALHFQKDEQYSTRAEIV